MACVSPYHIKLVNGETMAVDCGRCMQCRIKKQTAVKFLAQKELLEVYKTGRGASFVTLTYDDDNIPFVHLPTGNYYRGVLNFAFSYNEAYYTLCQKDIADFNKRVRRNMDYYKMKIPYKVIYCGEYGGQTDRPHAHIIFLGLSDLLAKKFTSKCWKFGLCDVGPLSAGGLDYVTKYLTKSETYNKDILALYHHCKVETPFFYHSVNLGKKWLLEHSKEIADGHYTFLCKGKSQLVPKNVRDFVKFRTGYDPAQDVNDYLDSTVVKDWKLANNKQSFQDYSLEQNYLREQFLIHSARSRGLNVNPEFIESKKWLKPAHNFDRLVDSRKDVFADFKPFWFDELKKEGYNISQIQNIFKKFSKSY